MRLIDANDVKRRGDCYLPDIRKTIANILSHTKTVKDAVVIVRCKDCKHRPVGDVYNHDLKFPDKDYKCPCRCEDFWYSWMPDDDWYCANGERKTNETDIEKASN